MALNNILEVMETENRSSKPNAEVEETNSHSSASESLQKEAVKDALQVVSSDAVGGANETGGAVSPSVATAEAEQVISLEEPEEVQLGLNGAKRPAEDVRETLEIPSKKQKIEEANNGNGVAFNEKEVDEVLRVGVVKRIMGLDYESGTLSASNDATFLVSKSVEMFLRKFIQLVLLNNAGIVKNEKKNIVKYAELVNTSRKHKELQFLYDLLPEI